MHDTKLNAALIGSGNIGAGQEDVIEHVGLEILKAPQKLSAEGA